MDRKLVAVIAGACLGAAIAPAWAQDAGPGGASALRPFCSDRPTQATQPCTVDAGHFQIETDLFNATYDRSGGMVTDTYLFTDPTLKYGLTPSADVEVAIAPYEEVRSHDPASGATQDLYGVGNLYLRYKQNLFGESGAKLGLAVEPFVKAPTARAGIGDGAWEGGVLVPFNAQLSKALSLNLNAELDVLKDMQGGGVHPSPVEIANLSWQATDKLNASVEVYAREDQDPAGVITQASGDLALAYMLNDSLQFDVGVNLGLNPQTPAVQAYTGVSRRF